MKMTVCLYWVATDWESDGGHYALHTSPDMDDYSGHGATWKLLGQQEVDFDVKPFDARELAVDALKKKKANVLAEATKEAKQIEDKIQQLLALPASVAA
jgi:hypothetical protein